MWRRELIAAVAGSAVATALGCRRRPPEPGSRLLRLSVSQYVMNSGFFVAHERGYFEQAGIDLETADSGNFSQTFPLLASGQLDVVMSPLSPAFLNAVRAGAAIRIVAARGVAAVGCPESAALYWRRGEYPVGVEGLRQLCGKRVAAGRQSGISEFLLDTMLEACGMGQDEVERVYLSEPEAVAALVSGNLGAIVGGGYFDRNLVEVMPQLMVGLPLADLLPDFQLSYIVYGRRLLENGLALGADFLSAYLQGAREFGEGATPAFLEQRAVEAGLGAGQGQNVCRASVSIDGKIRLEDLKSYVDWAVRRGYCEDPASPAELVDERFLNEVAGKKA